MTFAIRQLRASITINSSSSTPTFAGSGDSNTVTFGGVDKDAIRMKAEIRHAGGLDSTMDVTAYGLPLSVMNQLSTLGIQINLIPKNQIILEAGDSENGMAQAYVGSILSAYMDGQAQPEVAFRITAQASIAFAASPAKPQSFSGSSDVATIMSGIASKMGLKFENSGVTTKLADAYIWGSPRDQMFQVRDAAGINAQVINGVLAIWPKNGKRNGQIITLSPKDGSLIGYPTYTAYGVMLRSLYNPSFGLGNQVKVQDSQLPPANATWNVYGLDHDLECQTPSGKWESTLLCSSPKAPTPISR